MKNFSSMRKIKSADGWVNLSYPPPRNRAKSACLMCLQHNVLKQNLHFWIRKCTDFLINNQNNVIDLQIDHQIAARIRPPWILLTSSLIYDKIISGGKSWLLSLLRACSHDPGTTHCPGATHWPRGQLCLGRRYDACNCSHEFFVAPGQFLEAGYPLYNTG